MGSRYYILDAHRLFPPTAPKSEYLLFLYLFIAVNPSRFCTISLDLSFLRITGKISPPMLSPSILNYFFFLIINSMGRHDREIHDKEVTEATECLEQQTIVSLVTRLDEMAKPKRQGPLLSGSLSTWTISDS